MTVLGQGLPASALLIFGTRSFVLQAGRPVHCWMLSSVRGLHPLAAGRTPLSCLP